MNSYLVRVFGGVLLRDIEVTADTPQEAEEEAKQIWRKQMGSRLAAIDDAYFVSAQILKSAPED